MKGKEREREVTTKEREKVEKDEKGISECEL